MNKELYNIKNSFIFLRRFMKAITYYNINAADYDALDAYCLRNGFQKNDYTFSEFSIVFSFEIQLDFIDYWISYNELAIFT